MRALWSFTLCMLTTLLVTGLCSVEVPRAALAGKRKPRPVKSTAIMQSTRTTPAAATPANTNPSSASGSANSVTATPKADAGKAMAASSGAAEGAERQGPLAPTEANSATVISPLDGGLFASTEIDLQLHVQVPEGSTLLGIKALVDGRAAASLRGVSLSPPAVQQPGLQTTHNLKVPVPPHDIVLSVLVDTRPQKSKQATVRLRWNGASKSQEQVGQFQPKLYLLTIGVSEYQQKELALRFAAKDASDVAAAFRAQSRSLYRDVEAKTLTNQMATKNNILDALEWLQRQTTAKDIGILFLAGHGVTDPGSGAYYFLPFDADMGAMKRTMIPESEIRDTLSAVAGKVILFLDSCHSGKVFSAIQTRGPADLTAFIGELASAESGVVVFAASTGRQSSQESVAWNNGAFTKALIEGLSGRADFQKSGRITINMLDLYVSERVKELTDGRQTPTTAKPASIPDFPLAVTREIHNEDIDLVR